MAGHLKDSGGVRSVLAGQMARPVFPVPLEALKADLSFDDFRAGDALDLPGGIRAATAMLNHPDGATGYRIEFGDRALCYVTDTEHTESDLDANVLDLIRGADLVVYDCTYTDEEFRDHIGWGHSTWQQGVRPVQKSRRKAPSDLPITTPITTMTSWIKLAKRQLGSGSTPLSRARVWFLRSSEQSPTRA